MTSRFPLQRDVAAAALVMVLALTEAAQVFLGLSLLHADVTWGYAVRATLPSWVVFLALTLPLLRALDRVPRGMGASAGVGLAAGGVTFTLLHLGGTALAAVWIGMEPAWGFRDHFYRLATVYFVPDLLTFAALVTGHSVVRRYKEDRAREVEAASERADEAHARFLALRGQLRPDFFFNTLNAIGGLVARGEAARSVDALSSLSQLLRVGLTVEPGRPVPLDDEMELVTGYLSIQEARFPDRVRVAWDTRLGAGGCAVPALLLVQLVEAVVEGGLRDGGPFSVNVEAERRDGRLVVSVSHTGPDPETRVLDGLERRVRRFGDGASMSWREGAVEVSLAARSVPRPGRGSWMEPGVVT